MLVEIISDQLNVLKLYGFVWNFMYTEKFSLRLFVLFVLYYSFCVPLGGLPNNETHIGCHQKRLVRIFLSFFATILANDLLQLSMVGYPK